MIYKFLYTCIHLLYFNYYFDYNIIYLCIHKCIIIFDYFIYLNLVFSPVDNLPFSILEAILGHLFSVSMYNLFFLVLICCVRSLVLDFD